MKTITQLALLLALTGCGAPPAVDPALDGFLSHYLDVAPKANKLGSLVSIKFGDIAATGERGVCRKEESKVRGITVDETRTIVIDRNPFTPEFLALTVYHELGHCLHDLGHTDGDYDVMNGYRLGDSEFWTPEAVDQALTAMFTSPR